MTANYRSYGKYLDKSIDAIHSGIEYVNSINNPYSKESGIILMSNAWELLAKALLIKHSGDNTIYEKGSKKERTISAERAIHKLQTLGFITDLQEKPLQQLISIRNEASHQTLPDMDEPILFHLEYYAVRYFKEVLDANFKQYSGKLNKQFLSVSFDGVTTYSDSVKKLIARVRKNKGSDAKRAAYLLERGISFDGGEYMKQSDFDKIFKNTSRPMRGALKLGDYNRKADMIVVVPIQAPTGTRADITLTKSKGSTITTNIIKHATDDDYPYLTKDLSMRLGQSRHNTLQAITALGMKNNPQFHQSVRSSSSSSVQKYSDIALNRLKEHFTD